MWRASREALFSTQGDERVSDLQGNASGGGGPSVPRGLRAWALGIWRWMQQHLLKPSLIWLLLLGFALIFVNVLVDLSLHLGSAGHGAERETAITIWDVRVWAGLAREVGFALIISFILAVLIEQDSRRRQELEVKRYLARVSRNVFETVLGSFLPDRFREAFKDIGRTSVVRTDMVIRYEVMEFDPGELRGLADELRQFVKLHIFTEYKLKNISASRYTHKIENRYPVRSENQFYVDLSRITRLRIGLEEIDEEEIERLTGAPNEAHPDFRTFSKTFTIEPNEEIVVSYENVLVKERSDNEVWASLIPTDQLRMFCDVRLDGEYEFGVTAHCPSGMDERMCPSAGRGGVWASGGLILPYQSVVFWWREKLPADLNKRWVEAGAPALDSPP